MSITRVIDLVFVAIMALVFALKFAGATIAAIAVGAVAVSVVGYLFVAIAFVAFIIRVMSPHGDGSKDFSSFSPSEERAFVGHEQVMRGNGRRAGLVGFGIAAGAFLAGTGIVLAFYTPCSKYCTRPPVDCRTTAEQSAFMSGCESACLGLEKQKGPAFIENLQGCAFADSIEGSCGAIAREATAVGLWCARKED